ncbi:MAG: MFS transporter [Kineosporiaceae bacterium]|nr:MFS transporter [Kineosporiaceae bacterium]MBK7623593.1 MFS transporter [Kineosporiaceae bacterium]MBK8077936.1 MFS transporter [Kineosporiaceae bacterium]
MTLSAADLRVPGAGEELIAHLTPVLAGLERHRPDVAPAGPLAGSPVPASPPVSAASAVSVTLPGARTPHDPRAVAAEEREGLLDLFDAQVSSRWLDVAARRMRAAGEGFYTIGSAGHETNAAVALAMRRDDPALLHYRSGAFYLARAAQRHAEPTAGAAARRLDGIMDVALGLAASAHEPIAGGRHKVFGHPDLAVIPQTSTIASHLPRALGVAWAIGRQAALPARLRRRLHWPDNAVAVASFGDASANHSTAVGAINAARWAAHQGIPIPLLLLLEDNGIGISTRTPTGWPEAMFAAAPGLVYRHDDAEDPLISLRTAREAVDHAREQRVPVLLHQRTVRIGGHAGSDVESAYRSPSEIAGDLLRDPVAATMRALVEHGVLTAEDVRRRWAERRDEVSEAVAEALRRPRLTSAAEVLEPLSPRRPEQVAAAAVASAEPPERARVFGEKLPETEGGLTLAASINRALLDVGAAHAELLVLGEDVARKGGVYGVTRGLQRRLGASRVIDTVLDEQTVLGMALGAGVSGLLPVPEIQYLAYLHNALDQIRGEAASLQFFSQGAYRNPLVVRVQGLAYQKGFGGHFHNDNAIGALRDIPGLVIACPAHPSDAPAVMRTCLAAARVDGTVSVVLEPIALYHERDMLTPGDGGWLAPYTPPELWSMTHVPIGRAATWGTGTDLTIATFGNGLRMSLRAADVLARKGIGVRVVDLRWLAPLPVADVVREARATGRLLIVDETRRSGGVSEGLVTAMLEAGFDGRLMRIAGDDSYVPLGDAANLVLVQQNDIEDAAQRLMS